MTYETDNVPNQETTKLSSAPSIQNAEQLEQGYTSGIMKILEASESESICEYLDDTQLDDISTDLLTRIDEDRLTMSGYKRRYKRAIDLAKMSPEHKSKSFPFSGASNVMMPYIMEAALDFNARAMPALVERKNICKIDILGLDPQGLKQARGERVAMAINQDLRVGIKGWRETTDQALMLLPIVGTYFKKTYQCGFENKRVSQLIFPDKFIFDHTVSVFDDANRKSYEYTMSKNDVVTAVRTGEFYDIDVEKYYKEEEQITFIESHCWLDLDEDGYEEPYIVNLEKEGNQGIVSIVPRFNEDDIEVNSDNEIARIKAEEFFTQTIFIPDPQGSCMGMGWGILLGDTFSSINTHMQQLTDAGTLQNISANSGFIRAGSKLTGGSRQKKGVVKMQMGQFTTIETSGSGSLSQDIVQFPFNGPSTVLFQLMESLKTEVRQMTTAGQGMEGFAGEAAEMYLARLQQSLVTPNSIMVRVFNGVTKEINRIYEIMQSYLGQEEYTELTGDPQADWSADFADNVEISTTADPSQGSEHERIARAKIIYDESKMAPYLNGRAAAEDYFSAIGVKDLERILPAPQPNEPDPIQMMQMEAVKKMSEAEELASQAKMMQANTSMMEVQIKQMMMGPQIDKLEAEALKLLSEVDKNEQQAAIAALKETRENMAVHLKHNMEMINGHNKRQDAEDAHRRSKELAQESRIQGSERKLENAMQRATPRTS